MLFDSFRIASNRYETNRIFIAFISESIEKFTALEILSGTLQFTCAWQEHTHTQTATPTPSQTSTGSRQRVDSESSLESQVRSRKQAGGRRQAPPPTLRSANNSSCCQRISHATFLFILFSLLGGKFLACSAAKVALYEIRSIGSWLQLVFLHISLPIATFLLCCLPASLFLPL